MKFYTNLSKHCYYGNIANILSYYGTNITEAKLVLISNALSCNNPLNHNAFLGISNELCKGGLSNLGYDICNINSSNDYIWILNKNIPILLLINTSFLSYNTTFYNTNRNHYIVLITKNDDSFLISDSFLQTVPISKYEGIIESNVIINALKNNKAKGMFLKKKNDNIKSISEKEKLVEYFAESALCLDNSIINNLKKYSEYVLSNFDDIFNSEMLKRLAYDIKVAGNLARFEYIKELIDEYFFDKFNYDVLFKLKKQWELIANKLIKCSITLNKERFLEIYKNEIPKLINNELNFYIEVIHSGVLND